MKTLNIPLEDSKYNKLQKIKGKLSWNEFLDKIIIDSNKIKEGDLKDD